MPHQEGREAVYRNRLGARSASPLGRSQNIRPDAKVGVGGPANAPFKKAAKRCTEIGWPVGPTLRK